MISNREIKVAPLKVDVVGKDANNESEGAIELEGDVLIPDTKSKIEKGKWDKLFIGLQLSLTAVVFAVAYNVFRSSSTISLVPLVECGSCTTCETQFTFSASNNVAGMGLNVRIMNGVEPTDQYQLINFHGLYSSCGSESVGDYTFVPVHQSSVVYSYFPFNESGKQQWNWTNASNIPARNGIPLVDQIDAYVTGDMNGHSYIQDQQNQNMTADCFQIHCMVSNEEVGDIEYDEVSVQNMTLEPGRVKIHAYLAVIDKAVMATCTAVINGQAYNFKQSIQQSNTYLCTTETDWFNAASLAFSVANLAYTITNMGKYFSSAIRENNGVTGFITTMWFELVG